MNSSKNVIPALEGGKPVRKHFLVFGKPHIGKEEIEEVKDSLKTGWLGTGPKVARFEEMVRKYLGCNYTVALNSGTAGLHLSLMAIGVGPGDEVITTPMTFAATVNVIEHVGAKPIFADIDLESMNISPKEVEKKITKKTRAIIPVHVGGRPCAMDRIVDIASKHKLKVIEDAAHAFGAAYKGKKIGIIGDLTVFSFYVTKNLVTGEGGMVATSNKNFSEFVRLYSLHGLDKDAWKRYSESTFRHYLVKAPGYKYNMMDLQAAIGIHQLLKFKKNQERRAQIWRKYNQAFIDLPLKIPPETGHDSIHAHHLYTILVDDKLLKVGRDVVQYALFSENIGIGTHFIAVHLHPFYRKKYHLKRGDFPIAEFVSDRTISLPFSSGLSDGDVEDVIAAVRKVFSYYLKYKHKRKISHLRSLSEVLKDVRKVS